MWARLKRVTMLLGSVVLGLYLAGCFFLYSQQREIIFPAPKEGRPLDRNFETIAVPGGGLLGLRRPPDAAAMVVVHFHGNAEQLADEAWLADQFATAGLGFVAVEYPGYGLLAGQGAPTEESLVASGEQALQHVVGALGIERTRLVLSGQSIGTGAAVELAKRGWGQRLLLMTPYTSLPDLGARTVPFMPARWMMKDRFDSAAKAPSLSLPVLVIHGTADEVIPYELGQALAGRFPHARFLSIPGGHHNDLWDREEVRAQAVAFLRGR